MEDTVHSILRKALSQLALHEGFSKAQEHALDLFADIVRRYIIEVSDLAANNAALASRSNVNILDACAALRKMDKASAEDLFDGLMQSRKTLLEMKTNKDQRKQKLLPLPFELRLRPIMIQPTLASGEAMSKRRNKQPASKSHIPPHLPKAPELHTISASKIYAYRETDAKKGRKRKIDHLRDLETTIHSLASEAKTSL